jgi:cytochrome P450 family 9
MSFLAYELVCNPEIQQKLFEEIQEMESELDGKKISYEQIQRMKYLDQTISETLRKWPVAPVSFVYFFSYEKILIFATFSRLRNELV